MAKDPAFLFYSSDFLAGVQDLTMEERGQYITLLCLQHQKGHLSDKIISLAVADAAADVMAKFRHDPAGLWYNVRLDEEIAKRKAHTEKQRERALEGWKKRKNNAAGDTTANAAALPLEDTNENINGINKRVGDFYKNGSEAFEEIKADELMVERMIRTVHQAGFRAATPVQVISAVRFFLTKESAKPEFFYKPRDEIKSHLVNWISLNAKKITDYG